MPRSSLIVLSALVLPIVAACTPGAVTDPGVPTLSGPAETATPTPSATQERETRLVPPAAVFGGDCGALFTDAQVSNAIGVAMTRYPEAGNDLGYAIPLVGGIDCTWTGSDRSRSHWVRVVAMPAAAVPDGAPTGCFGTDFSEIGGCALEVVHNGIRLSGAIFDIYNGAHATAAMQSSLLAAFEENATTDASAPLPLPAAGSWNTNVDCAAIAAAGDYSGVPGLGASTTGRAWYGIDGYTAPAAHALWEQFPPAGCGLFGSDAEVGYLAIGGMRWRGAEIAADAGATPLSVAGVDEAWVYSRDGRSYINVLDGPNWLSFDVAFVSNAPAIAQQLVAALDATAIP